jgi:hypothetical protein
MICSLKRVSAIVVISAVLLTCTGTAHAAVLGLWRFDEGAGTTVADGSGWANPAATLQAAGGSSLPTWMAGHTGAAGDYALQFSSGSNNNVLQASIAGAVSGTAEMHQVTYAAWVYNAAQTTFGRIVDGSAAFYISPNNENLGASLPNTFLGDHGNGTGPAVPTGTWSHVAVVVDRNKTTGQQSRTYYVNGVPRIFNTEYLKSSGTSGTQLNDLTTSLLQAFLVGNRADWLRPFEGSIDDLAVFNQALSQAQIQTIMSGDYSAFLVDRTVALNKNLVVNGNAELDPGDFDNNRNLRVTGWQDPNWTSPLLYQDKGGETWAPNHALVDGSHTADGGNNFFTGGRGSANSTMTQLVDVSSLASLIDLSAIRYDLSGWFGGFAGNNDLAYLTARFLDATSGELGSVTIGGYSPADLGYQTKMLFDSDYGKLPAGTRTIEMKLFMQIDGAGYNDAMADNLSLVLTYVPEPASLSLWALGGLGLLLVRRPLRRR